jgi:hypothetical protein
MNCDIEMTPEYEQNQNGKDQDAMTIKEEKQKSEKSSEGETE